MENIHEDLGYGTKDKAATAEFALSEIRYIREQMMNGYSDKLDQ